MNTLQLDYDEGIILENEDVYWASRDDLELTNFTLTNKKLYCTYEKDNGFFKKSTSEMYVLALSDIKIINGQALVQQIKYDGSWCLQIQFKQGTEYFAFSDSPKKVIPQWIAAINNTLGIVAVNSSTTAPKAVKRNNPFGGVFAGAFSEVADNFKSVVDTAAETFGIPTKQAEQRSQTNGVYAQPVQTQPTYHQTVEAQEHEHSFCVNCGAQLAPGAKFCSSCGCKVGATDSNSAPAQETIVQKEETIATPPISVQPATQMQREVNAKPANSQRQQEYVGKVFKCPHCGEVVNQSDTVCGGCGYHLSGKQAMVSAIDFQQQLLNIEMRRQDRKISLREHREVLDATDKQMIALIKSYPIPNSIEDIVEFFHLAIGNIDVNKSKKSIFNSDDWDGGSRERSISNAWVGKLQQVYKKAELYFPNEPEFAHIKETYLQMMNDLKLKG